MKRSDIIAKARGRVVQGSEDSFWTPAEWNDYFHDAIDNIHAAICDADLPYYITKNVTVTKNSSDAYPLPEDCFAVRSVREVDTDEPIYKIGHEDEYADEREETGFQIVDDTLVLLGFATLPDTLKINYRRFPKDMGDVTVSTEDATVIVADPDGDEDFVPDRPLHNNRGARIICDIMVILSQAKDESLVTDQVSLMQAKISNFVDRLSGMNQTEEAIIGYD